jgi:hypothetical protein
LKPSRPKSRPVGTTWRADEDIHTQSCKRAGAHVHQNMPTQPSDTCRTRMRVRSFSSCKAVSHAGMPPRHHGWLGHLDVPLAQCVVDNRLVLLHTCARHALGPRQRPAHTRPLSGRLHAPRNVEPHAPASTRRRHSHTEHVEYTTYPPVALCASTRSMAASSSCFCRWPQRQMSSWLLLVCGTRAARGWGRGAMREGASGGEY